MKNAKNKNVRIITVAILVALSVLSMACDKNMAKPEDLSPVTSVSIGDFSASSVKIVSGESTTLTWSVEDEDGKVQSVSIDPDVGNVPMSGAKNVKPKKTTIYHLNVHSNNEIVKSRSIGITVTDDEGNELVEEPVAPVVPIVEAVCNDSTDEDQDGATDCDDSDCGEASACQEPVIAFSACSQPPQATADSVFVGDEVSITWAGCPFGSVIVNHSATYDSDQGAYSVDTSVAGVVSVVLHGVTVGGGVVDTAPFSITVAESQEPEFSAEIKTFKITPGNVIYGQSYDVEWSVQNAQSVNMDGEVEFDGRLESLPGTETKTYTLTVTDFNGITQNFKRTVTVKKFEAGGKAFEGSVSQMVPGSSQGEYYAVGTDHVIYHTTDYWDTHTTISPKGVDPDLLSVAVSNGSIFVGTVAGDKGGVYKSADTYKWVTSSGGRNVTTLLARQDSTLLAGTNRTAFILTANADGFYHTSSLQQYFGNGTHIYKFIKSATDSKYIVALTSSGVYESQDEGTSFSIIANLNSGSIQDGDWNTGSAYLWSGVEVFSWSGGEFQAVQTGVASGINYVVKVGGNIFVAHDGGVAVKGADGVTVQSNLAEAVQFLVVKHAFLGGQLYAITASGDRYKLNLSKMAKNR